MKKYEVECTRHNVSPCQFYSYCKKQFLKKARIDLEMWIEYNDWFNPMSSEEYHVNKHEEWDKPLKEIIKIKPYEYQMYLQNTYNFIMEFNFDDDKKGDGYMYAVEYKEGEN